MRHRAGDHPRGCGENTFVCFHFRAFLGITPADAGKTAAAVKKLALCQDHPRGCGENCPHPTSQRARLGSPPRMRGKPQVVLNVKCFFGITPADAGKTFDSLT